MKRKEMVSPRIPSKFLSRGPPGWGELGNPVPKGRSLGETEFI